MHTKVHYQDDQDALFKLCGGVMTRLLDADAKVKSAASEAIPKSVVEQFKPPTGKFAQHMIIMGDGEQYGWNRNGDWWSKAANTKYHPTFVSHGAYYREHRHRSKDQAIGEIKYAAHNDPMSRVELIVWGDIKKANDIYEALKSGESRSNSMSARVPFDVCSVCSKQASSPASYCSHAKHRMGQWIPEFRKYAYVDNPNPTFFDASDVANPADRIAHYLEYAFPEDAMRKVASSDFSINGNQWAEFEGVALPIAGIALDPVKQANLQRLAEQERWLSGALAEHYKGVANNSPKLAYAMEAGPHLLDGELTDAQLGVARKLRTGTFFGELAKRGAILPFHTFAAYIQGADMDTVRDDPTVKCAASLLPDIFSSLLETGCGCDESAAEMFAPSSPGVISIDPAVDDPVKQLMDVAEKKFSIKSEPVKSRVIHIIIKAGNVAHRPALNKPGSVNTPKAEVLAGLYGLYKVAAISAMRDLIPGEVDERQELLLAAHHNFLHL